MLNIVLLVLALVPLVRPDCGVGEVFTTCGTACEDTCDNYLDESRLCTTECVTGCFCEVGKVRSEPDHRCVDTSECPDCGVGEVFEACGTACEDTCDNYLDESRVCTMNCVTGCFCEGGKVRSEPDHRCVDTSECPVCGANQEYGCGSVRPDCGVGEVFTTCGTACEDTCDNYLDESRVCTLQCVTGCFCEGGKVRSEPDNRCVDTSECPVCGANQVFTTCGTACEDTCDNYLDESRVCTMNCVTGCFCEGGKVRSEPDNRCVDTSECPVCGANQEYGCGSVCPDTCDNYDAPRACIEICR